MGAALGSKWLWVLRTHEHMSACVSTCGVQCRRNVQHLARCLFSLSILFIPDDCVALRSSSWRHILDNGNCSLRMHERCPLELAKIQDRQEECLLVGELVGLQRHFVLGHVAPELPRGVNLHRGSEMGLCVDHTSLLLYVLLILCLQR